MSTSTVFSDIIGHESIIRVLEHALAKPAHGYLFCGPRGVGKRAVAERFAATLLAESRIDNREWGEGSIENRESRIENGIQIPDSRFPIPDSHPDFVRILREEGAREIVVKQARELIARMQLTSARGGYKIALIEEANRLNEEAANALLKAVEEPSKNTVYIFLAEQPDHLPATLRSRLVKMEFGRVPTRTIEEWLVRLVSLSFRAESDGAEESLAATYPNDNILPGHEKGIPPLRMTPVGMTKGTEQKVREAAAQSRGYPGIAYHLAFDEERPWHEAVDWSAILASLLGPSPQIPDTRYPIPDTSFALGKQLATIETLTKTVESQSDVEVAWHEALDHLMRGLDPHFVNRPIESSRLAQGLSYAWKLVGSAISPRLAIEYALIPDKAKEGRMVPRILC